jgi:capsular polysaccharide export protein
MMKGLPVVRLEDGFIRSLGLGRGGDPPYSLVVDERGMFYDTRRPSDLEVLLNGAAFDPATLAEADRVIETVRRTRITKYNHLPRREAEPVDALVIDQAFQDRSVRFGGAGQGTFRRMLEAALAENRRVAVRTHPDAVAGYRKSHFGPWVEALGARLEPATENLPDRLATVGKVYCATSQTGFEALIHGVPVATFGRPFYAGWGLTDDRAAIPRRERRLTLRELVAAALVLYPRYVDPANHAPLTPAAFMERMAAWRDRHAAA